MCTGEAVLVAITAHLSSCRCPVTIIDMSFLLSPVYSGGYNFLFLVIDDTFPVG